MFHITTKLDYGLILLRALAKRHGTGPMTLRAIAREHRLPYHYLAQIVMPLKAAGILKSQEGARGGYELARKPQHITLQEISSALVHKETRGCALADEEVCKRKGGCDLSPWWTQFNSRFQRLLRDMTLEDLL